MSDIDIRKGYSIFVNDIPYTLSEVRGVKDLLSFKLISSRIFCGIRKIPTIRPEYCFYYTMNCSQHKIGFIYLIEGYFPIMAGSIIIIFTLVLIVCVTDIHTNDSIIRIKFNILFVFCHISLFLSEFIKGG